MPDYKYKAKSVDNKVVKGKRNAKDEEDLSKSLRRENLFLISSKLEQEKQLKYKLKSQEVSEFSRQIADMVSSGITVSRALSVIKDRATKPKIKAVYSRLHKDLQNGLTLSEAMRNDKGSFPELFINMYASGEENGQFEKTARKMAENYDREYKLNSKIRIAMMYPAILMTVTIAVVIIIFTVVLPSFFELFEGIELPTVTKGVIAVSNFLINYWYYLIIAVLLVVFIVKAIISIPKVKVKLDKTKLNIPMVGKLLKIIYTARFSRTLSSLYSSGLPMIRALKIASTVIGNKYIEKQFDSVIFNVRNGEPLSDSIDDIDGFDKKLSSVIYIAEESGRLDSMLENVAESFDYEADVATTKLVKLLEPTMIVIMAVIIGSIMMSVLLPILTLYQNVA